MFPLTESSFWWAIFKVLFGVGGGNVRVVSANANKLSFAEKLPIFFFFLPIVKQIAWIGIRISMARKYLSEEGYYFDPTRLKIVSVNIVEPSDFEDAVYRFINGEWKQEESVSAPQITNIEIARGPLWSTVRFIAQGGAEMGLVGVAKSSREDLEDLVAVIQVFSNTKIREAAEKQDDQEFTHRVERQAQFELAVQDKIEQLKTAKHNP